MKQSTMNRIIYFLRLPVDYGGELFFSGLFALLLTALTALIMWTTPLSLPFVALISAWWYAANFFFVSFVFFFYVIYGFVKSDSLYGKVTPFEHWLHRGYTVDEQLICDSNETSNSRRLPDEFITEMNEHNHEQGFGLFSRKDTRVSSFERNTHVWVFKRKQDAAAFKMKYATKG